MIIIFITCLKICSYKAIITVIFNLHNKKLIDRQTWGFWLPVELDSSALTWSTSWCKMRKTKWAFLTYTGITDWIVYVFVYAYVNRKHLWGFLLCRWLLWTTTSLDQRTTLSNGLGIPDSSSFDMVISRYG